MSSNQVIVDRSKLVAIADAIRAKTGTTADLTLDQMVTAIGTIPDKVSGYVDIVKNGGEIISFDNITTSSGDRLFQYRNKITKILMPNAFTNSNNYAYQNQFCDMTNLVYLIIGINYCSIQMAQRNTKLQGIDLTASNLSTINANAFGGCTVLDKLIIRKTSGIVTLANINALGDTAFSQGNTGGTLYVPQTLISSYQSASNWSTILGYETNSIVALEGSEYENNYVDGTAIAVEV